MFKIYTDGSCLGNPGPGGWAAIILGGKKLDRQKIISGYVKNATNNQMELYAVIKALDLFYKRGVKDDQVLIYSDSLYVINNIRRLDYWESTDFKDGKIKNIKLWKKLIKALDRVPASFTYVKAHNGDKYNEIADEEAKKMSKLAKQRKK